MARERKTYKGYRLPTEESASKELKRRRDRAEKNAGGKTTNSTFALNDTEFQEACQKAGVKPTDRQASKWRHNYGAAARAAGRNTRRDPLRA